MTSSKSNKLAVITFLLNKQKINVEIAQVLGYITDIEVNGVEE